MHALAAVPCALPPASPSCCQTAAWHLIRDVPLAAVGKVNSIGNDYISMLVMGVFNAVIEAESIRKEFKCDFTVGGRSVHTATCSSTPVEHSSRLMCSTVGCGRAHTGAAAAAASGA